jgi:hypothetical protein
MAECNEYGGKCFKCEQWVDPYKGVDFLEATLCRNCYELVVVKLLEFGMKDD